MASVIGEGTAQGNLEYLGSLVEKGRSRSGVIAPLRTALKKVLQETEGPGWQQTDMRSFNVDDAMGRFKNLTLGQYSQDSYRAYGARVARAISWYRKFLDNPGWSPQESSRESTIQNKQAVDKSGFVAARAAATAAGPSIAQSDAQPRHQNQFAQTPAQILAQQPSRMALIEASAQAHGAVAAADSIVYPFPLQSGAVASLQLPRAISRNDIKRLSAFLEALVVDDPDRAEDRHGQT